MFAIILSSAFFFCVLRRLFLLLLLAELQHSFESKRVIPMMEIELSTRLWGMKSVFIAVEKARNENKKSLLYAEIRERNALNISLLILKMKRNFSTVRGKFGLEPRGYYEKWLRKAPMTRYPIMNHFSLFSCLLSASTWHCCAALACVCTYIEGARRAQLQFRSSSAGI